jgi:hypothetical protein
MDQIRRASEAAIRTIALTIFLFLLFSCGVKTPPSAPVRPDQPIPQNLDCSPTDPACDKTDPNYKPGGR